MPGSGGDTQTTTQHTDQTGGTTYAPWTQDLQRAIGGIGLGLSQNFFGQAPKSAVAGFNLDQQKGFDLARGTALQYGVDNASSLINGLGDRSQAQAATIDTDRIGELMNPYMQTVGRNTVDSMRREYQNNDASMASRYANGSAFGGSGEAIARGQAARGYSKDVGDMMSTLMAQGYDRASAQALAEAQMRQQTNLANAGNAINAASAASNILTQDQQRQLSAIGGLLDVGRTQQDLAQRELDVPFDKLSWLAKLVPGVYDTNSWLKNDTVSTQPDNSTGSGQGLLGLGTTILGAGTGGGNTVIGGLLGKLFG